MALIRHFVSSVAECYSSVMYTARSSSLVRHGCYYLRRHHRIALALGWLGLLLTAYIILTQTDLDTRTIALSTLTILTSYWWGPVVFLAAYIVRPLLLLPVSIFSVASGVVFGLWPGLLVTYVGILVSSIVAYVVGRWFGQSLTHAWGVPDRPHLVHRRPFEVVLGLHLTMLPFDVINYTMGAIRIAFVPFLIGLMLGMIPGTISLTALGASIDVQTLLTDGVSTTAIDLRYLLLSVTVFLCSLLGSYLYRRYYRSSYAA